MGQVAGYTAYSSVPAMGYSNTPTSTEVKSDQLFSGTATVTDKDEYMRTSDNQIVQIANNETDVVARIVSGAVLSISNNYDLNTGTRTKIWNIRATDVAPGTVVVYVDRFVAMDTSVNLLVKDADGEEMTCTVSVARMATPPPEGGEGEKR